MDYKKQNGLFFTVKPGLMVTKEDEDCTYLKILNQLDVTNLLVVSVSNNYGEQLHHHPV